MMEDNNMQPQEEAEYNDNPILSLNDDVVALFLLKARQDDIKRLVSEKEEKIKSHDDFDPSTWKELYGDILTIREIHRTSEPLTIKELRDAGVDTSVYIDKWQLSTDASYEAIVMVAATYGDCLTIKIDHKAAKEIVGKKELMNCRNAVEHDMEVVLTGSEVKALLNSTEGLPSEIYNKLNFGKQSTISFSKIRSNK